MGAELVAEPVGRAARASLEVVGPVAAGRAVVLDRPKEGAMGAAVARAAAVAAELVAAEAVAKEEAVKEAAAEGVKEAAV